MRALLLTLVACTSYQTRIIVVRQAQCQSALVAPAVSCESELRLDYDGCRWGCRIEMRPARMNVLDLGADIEAVQQTSLCASPNYCEGQ